MFFLWYLLIGLVAGWLANLIVKGRGSGLIINLLVGIVGGVLGGWLVSLFGWIPVGTLGTLLTSLGGAIFLLLIASLFIRRDDVA
ncbi:MAG: GlsB/YeaQ/YmgE family stress response membrane protein [Rikenellaceae bacterium]|nr:GlsB/YeaQ/YmgE family stress response membrane protein [Rikenellaceae bacterium]MBQ7342852.1 GlsB/YeaQ/YmgE family stress response membrane protein [Alistipes sp.]